jgi:hypothetical protein
MPATPVASQSGSCQLVYSGLAQPVDQSALAEPSRAMVRLMPNAKLSSLPLNHLASAVVTATMSGSAPTPSRNRPAAMTANCEDMAVTAAAARQMRAKSVIDFFVPHRSMMYPPTSSTSTAAML